MPYMQNGRVLGLLTNDECRPQVVTGMCAWLQPARPAPNRHPRLPGQGSIPSAPFQHCDVIFPETFNNDLDARSCPARWYCQVPHLRTTTDLGTCQVCSRAQSVFATRWSRRRTCQPLLQDQDPSYNVTALVLDWYIPLPTTYVPSKAQGTRPRGWQHQGLLPCLANTAPANLKH